MKQYPQSSVPDFSEDILLLKKISEKDTNALARFYDIHSKYLLSIIYFILKDTSESEDVLQDVFLLIWEKADTFNINLGSPVSWFTRITRNKAIDRLRSKSFRKRSSETDIENIFDISSDSVSDNPFQRISESGERELINNAMSKLERNQKELIELAYYSGYSQTELAEYFKIPLGTVKTRMRSAIMKLRIELKQLSDN